MSPGTSLGKKCLPQLKIRKERFPRLKILTGISLVPPLLLGPVGPKLDLALDYLRSLKNTHAPPSHLQTFSFTWYGLQPGRQEF